MNDITLKQAGFLIGISIGIIIITVYIISIKLKKRIEKIVIKPKKPLTLYEYYQKREKGYNKQ